MMNGPKLYEDLDGYKYMAMKLSHKNGNLVEEWCQGRQVRTFDPTNSGDEEGLVGINFMGKDDTERLSEGEYLLKMVHWPWFFKVDAQYFESNFKRA